MILLYGLDAVTGFFQCGDAEGGCFRATQGRGDGGAGIYRSGADFYFVLARGCAAGSVDDELNFFILQKIDDVRAAFHEFLHALDFEAGFFQYIGGAGGGQELKSQV